VPHPQINWHRVFGIYFVLAAASLAAACFTTFALHSFFLFFAAALVVAFVPLVMTIYFLRGLL
jgi:hypothetical protein